MAKFLSIFGLLFASFFIKNAVSKYSELVKILSLDWENQNLEPTEYSLPEPKEAEKFIEDLIGDEPGNGEFNGEYLLEKAMEMKRANLGESLENELPQFIQAFMDKAKRGCRNGYGLEGLRAIWMRVHGRGKGELKEEEEKWMVESCYLGHLLILGGFFLKIPEFKGKFRGNFHQNAWNILKERYGRVQKLMEEKKPEKLKMAEQKLGRTAKTFEKTLKKNFEERVEEVVESMKS